VLAEENKGGTGLYEQRLYFIKVTPLADLQKGAADFSY